MATKKGIDAFAFVKDFLTSHTTASFAEVRDAAKAAGHKVFPIVYGRAKLLLGQVGVKPATKKKAAARKAAKKAAKTAATSAAVGAVRRGPGRPRKVPVVLSGLSGLDAVIAHVRELERERNQLRATVEKLRGVLAAV